MGKTNAIIRLMQLKQQYAAIDFLGKQNFLESLQEISTDIFNGDIPFSAFEEVLSEAVSLSNGTKDSLDEYLFYVRDALVRKYLSIEKSV